MAWKNCVACGRSYNDAIGGCTNSACSMFGQPALASGSSSSPPVFVVSPVPKPVMRPKPMVVPKHVVITPVVPDVPILQWIAPSLDPVVVLAPMGIPLLPQAFTMTCYRGEKSEWWPPPETRLACGMTIRQPWAYGTMTDLWNELVKDMRVHGAGTVGGYAQYLRVTGHVYALASARTRGGAFEGYNYEIEIKNARTFYWGPNFTLGPPANFNAVGTTMTEEVVDGKLKVTRVDQIADDYIVLNADTIAASTVLGFGHKTGTYEVTFFHDMPIGKIIKCNDKPTSSYRILTKGQVQASPDTKENKWAKELLR